MQENLSVSSWDQTCGVNREGAVSGRPPEHLKHKVLFIMLEVSVVEIFACLLSNMPTKASL